MEVANNHLDFRWRRCIIGAVDGVLIINDSIRGLSGKSRIKSNIENESS
jgi:hypothetical protein